MKFKIRFADQIVGFFSLLALALLFGFIFALGASQKWFVKKNIYYTYFPCPVKERFEEKERGLSFSGSNAIMTYSIILSVVSLERTCGEDDTLYISLTIYTPLSYFFLLLFLLLFQPILLLLLCI